MSAIAIITARSGSKRIPLKNIKAFCGKPIMLYSIEAALKSGIFDEVMVSTDSVEFAELAIKAGAKVPFLRSKEASSDYASTADVLIEVIDNYNKIGRHFDYVCCIYPTAPFITEKKLIDAYTEMTNKKADGVISVVKFSFPPQRGFIIKDEMLAFQNPEYEKTRSQDLAPLYHDCGQFYFIKTELLLKNNSLITKKTIPFIVDEREVQDIDTISDWEIAEMKYRVSHKDI